MTDNTTNFHQVAEHLKNAPESTVSTNTSTSSKKPQFGKSLPGMAKKSTNTEIKLKSLSDAYKELRYVNEEIIKYLHQLEKQLANSKIRETAALLELYDIQYKDCPKIKEDSLNKEDHKNYISVLGHYCKDITKNEIVKILPLEYGWKLVKITPNDPEKPTSYKADYEFTGIITDPNYPTTFSIENENPNIFLSKLREFLSSLKDNKIIL